MLASEKIKAAVDSGEGLLDAFKKCTETQPKPTCETALIDALQQSEVIAQVNYDLAARLMPQYAKKLNHIGAEETVHEFELKTLTLHNSKSRIL